MSNPATPRQEENWVRAGRRWPDWKKAGTAATPPAPEPTNPNGAQRPSWCGLDRLSRTAEQIAADDRELAERKARKAIGGQP